MAFVKLDGKDYGICSVSGPHISAQSNDLGIWCGAPAGVRLTISRRVRDTEHPKPDKPTPLPLLSLTRESIKWDCRKKEESAWKEGEIKIVADEMDPKSQELYTMKLKRFYISSWSLMSDGATRDETIEITAWELSYKGEFGADTAEEQFKPVPDNVANS